MSKLITPWVISSSIWSYLAYYKGFNAKFSIGGFILRLAIGKLGGDVTFFSGFTIWTKGVGATLNKLLIDDWYGFR